MISDAGEILYPSSPDEYDRVLLQIVSLSGNIGSDLETVDEPDSGDLTDGLFWGQLCSAGALVFFVWAFLPFRTN